MANPLMGMMGGGVPAAGMNMQAIGQIKQMMNTLKAVKNPQQVLSQVAQQNPQLNSIMQMVGNRNPRDVFIEQCKAHGLNPDETMNQIQSIMSGN